MVIYLIDIIVVVLALSESKFKYFWQSADGAYGAPVVWQKAGYPLLGSFFSSLYTFLETPKTNVMQCCQPIRINQNDLIIPTLFFLMIPIFRWKEDNFVKMF